MLSNLYFPLLRVGLTEIKIKVGQDLLPNTNLSGYSFTSLPSVTNVGGVGFFMNNNQLSGLILVEQHMILKHYG